MTTPGAFLTNGLHVRANLGVLALLTLTACSTPLSRTDLHDLLQPHQPNAAQSPSATVPLTKPATSTAPRRLGVVFLDVEFPTRQQVRPLDWVSEERTQMREGLQHSLATRRVQEVTLLNPSHAEQGSLTELRRTAARYGADLLLIVSGLGVVDRRNNGYALLYPTLLGAYLAPGTISDALCLVEGSLWDVHTGTSYGSVDTDGQASLTGPAMKVDDRVTLTHAAAAAVDRFIPAVTALPVFNDTTGSVPPTPSR